jgi:hypothetical protein
MSTFSTLYFEVQSYGFDATVYQTRIQTWLNEGQRVVARMLNLPMRETDQVLALVANTNAYALSATFQRLLYVVNDTDDTVLQPIEEVEYETLSNTERGVPRYCFISNGSSVVLYPAPSQAEVTKSIRVHYVGLPTVMVAGADPTGFPQDYDLVLKAYALKEAYAAEDDFQASAFWDKQFKERLIQMGEDLNELDYSGPVQVPGAWGF